MADALFAQSRLRREAEVGAQLPYARHLNDAVVALDSGALMMMFQVSGASFETADAGDLNAWHVRLNQAWRNLADDRLAVWHHVVRREIKPPASTGYRSDFAAELAVAYETRMAGRRLWVNDLFLTLILHPGRDGADRTAAMLRRLRRAQRDDAEVLADQVSRLEEAGRDLAQHLAPYEPRRLGLVERDGLWCSEPLEVIQLILTGRRAPLPLVRGHLGAAAYTVRAIFGRETLELRDVAAQRYGGILAIKEYPAATRPGLWNALQGPHRTAGVDGGPGPRLRRLPVRHLGPRRPSRRRSRPGRRSAPPDGPVRTRPTFGPALAAGRGGRSLRAQPHGRGGPPAVERGRPCRQPRRPLAGRTAPRPGRERPTRARHGL